MTVKEIAKATGKPERTVRDWVRKTSAKSAEVAAKSAEAGPGVAGNYDLEETCLIIETGLGKNAASLYRENAANKNAVATSDIAAIVRETITAMVPTLIEVIKGVVPQQALALPAPAELTQRDQLRRVVNEYARRSGDHSGAWRELYTQFYYRYHRNIRECAKNRQMDTLDYAENEGILGDLLSFAVSIFGGAV